MDNTKISQGISLYDVYITHYIDRISGTNLLQRLFPQRNQLRWKKLTLFVFFCVRTFHTNSFSQEISLNGGMDMFNGSRKYLFY